ncbi:MAG: ceramidase [Chitinophagales bacterium]|nr:ceramidase [Chitinophagales bacterium]MCZ2393135.1 ceramidase [Chitinophagales bacterium]
MIPERRAIFTTTLIVAIVSVSLFTIAIFFHWLGEPAGAGAGFCEAGHPGLIKQPVNTFSNIGFIIVGLLIGWSQASGHFKENKNLITQGLFFSTFFACLSVLLGPGSMAMHATTSHVGGFLDMLSMYMVASFIFSYAITRLMKWDKRGFIGAFIFAMTVQLIVHHLDYEVPVVGFIGSFCFGVFLVLTAIIEFINYIIHRPNIQLIYGIASILAMCLAFFIWNLSLSTSPWCDPSSLIQGHGIWHILNAVSIYFLYRFYTSERN